MVFFSVLFRVPVKKSHVPKKYIAGRHVNARNIKLLAHQMGA